MSQQCQDDELVRDVLVCSEDTKHTDRFSRYPSSRIRLTTKFVKNSPRMLVWSLILPWCPIRCPCFSVDRHQCDDWLAIANLLLGSGIPSKGMKILPITLRLKVPSLRRRENVNGIFLNRPMDKNSFESLLGIQCRRYCLPSGFYILSQSEALEALRKTSSLQLVHGGARCHLITTTHYRNRICTMKFIRLRTRYMTFTRRPITCQTDSPEKKVSCHI